MYNAIITPIVNLRPHPGADRIVLGNASGYQVITSKDIKEGTLGIFFPSDGKLSHECLKENNLYQHTEFNKDPDAKPGFFGNNGRVRVQKFRGEPSEGFWTTLNILSWTGADLSKLKEGDLISKLNGKLVCEKYYTPATLRALNRQKSKKGNLSKLSQVKEKYLHFREHIDTQQLRTNIKSIPEGAILYISCKLHGSSGRTGYLQADHSIPDIPWWVLANKPWKIRRYFINLWLLLRVIFSSFAARAKIFWNKLVNKKLPYKYVTGSRRVILDTKNNIETGYYSGKTFRIDIHNRIKAIGLHPNETLYYEIVGYQDENLTTIMPSHNVEDKELKKQYGKKMTYTYGCKPGQHKIFIYRITYTLDNGTILDLPFLQMVERCKKLGLEAVPLLEGPIIYDGDKNKLFNKCEILSRGNSTLDNKHIKEGVVVKVEAPGYTDFLKYKSWHFANLEGIAKNTPEYLDLEDIS